MDCHINLNQFGIQVLLLYGSNQIFIPESTFFGWLIDLFIRYNNIHIQGKEFSSGT